jgi:hypothetical protein
MGRRLSPVDRRQDRPVPVAPASWTAGGGALTAPVCRRRFRVRGPIRTAQVELAEPGAHPLRVGMAEVGKDDQCLVPGAAGGVPVSFRTLRVTEVGEDRGLVVAVAQILVQREGLLVAGDGPLVVAELVVGVTEAVPGGRLAIMIAELLQEGSAPAGNGRGPGDLPDLGVAPADRVEDLARLARAANRDRRVVEAPATRYTTIGRS